MSDFPKFELLESDESLVCDVETGVCTPASPETEQGEGEEQGQG